MKGLGKKFARVTSVLAVIAALILAGCAPAQTGKATRGYSENYRFVPRIHVEDDFGSHTSMDYYQCSYDIMYEGYWCLVNE